MNLKLHSWCGTFISDWNMHVRYINSSGGGGGGGGGVQPSVSLKDSDFFLLLSVGIQREKISL